MSGCECTWKYHQGKPCQNEAADHGNVRTSPKLCMQCLFVCCAEEEEQLDLEKRDN